MTLSAETSYLGRFLAAPLGNGVEDGVAHGLCQMRGKGMGPFCMSMADKDNSVPDVCFRQEPDKDNLVILAHFKSSVVEADNCRADTFQKPTQTSLVWGIGPQTFGAGLRTTPTTPAPSRRTFLLWLLLPKSPTRGNLLRAL